MQIKRFLCRSSLYRFFIMIKGDRKIIFASVTKIGKKTTNKFELLFFQNKFTLQHIELNINKWTIKLFLISSINSVFSSLKTRRKLYENSVFGVTLIRIFPTFSRIWTEYGEILRISPYAVQMRENAGKMQTRISPNTNTFYAVRLVYTKYTTNFLTLFMAYVMY